jgi:hypothetical protein
MLLRIDDVCSALEEEGRDSGNDSGPVCTGSEETNMFVRGQTSSLGATLEL